MSYKFFTNKECEYYPCHNLENINCLFCFCPLYYIDNCGGNYTVLDNGLKNCSKCKIQRMAMIILLKRLKKIQNNLISNCKMITHKK